MVLYLSMQNDQFGPYFQTIFQFLVTMPESALLGCVLKLNRVLEPASSAHFPHNLQKKSKYNILQAGHVLISILNYFPRILTMCIVKFLFRNIMTS